MTQTIINPKPTPSAELSSAKPSQIEPSPVIGPDGMTDEEYYVHFSNLVERFVRQRAIETSLTMPRDANRVAETTFQAVAYVLRTYGMKRLNDPWLTTRLADFSDLQITELVAALGRMQPRFLAITNELVAEIEGLKE